MIKILKKQTFEEFYKVNEEVAKTSPMRCHYHSHNPLERWLWERKKKNIAKILEDLPLSTLIDLGCGDAGLLDEVPGSVEYTGVDISPTQVKYARDYVEKRARKHAKVFQGDILHLHFPDNSFDAALACDVVEHVLSPKLFFQEAKRIVKKGGFLIFSIPNEFLWEGARLALLRFPLRSPDHINAIAPSDIKRIFPVILQEQYLPIPFSARLSLIHIFVVKNVK